MKWGGGCRNGGRNIVKNMGLFYHVFSHCARVIFHYITAQNLEDSELNLPEIGRNPSIKIPGEALAGVKNYKITYSELYCHLCEIAGLKCKIVSGRVKGSEWHPYHPCLATAEA